MGSHFFREKQNRRSEHWAFKPLALKIPTLGIRERLVMFFAALLAVSLGIIVLIGEGAQREQAEKEMLEKSRLLAQQMNAAWEFVERNQDIIDTDSDGSRHFKGIYCAVAGKSIAAHFTRETDYVIRYISETPRKKKARPDKFEADALSSFKNGMSEYHGLTEYEDNKAFRYATPLFVEESCLECHGEPAGEIDVTGNPKEGLAVGDIGGAISIIMPVELYMDGIENNIARQTTALFLVMAAAIGAIYWVVSKLVMRPVFKLKGKAQQLEAGNLDIETESIRAVGEIRDLADSFFSMALQIKKSRDGLEEQVGKRTRELAAANDTLRSQRIELERMNVKLQEESKYKSDFLAIMSHELRTPLTSILAFTELWEESPTEKSPEDLEMVREIRINGQLLLQMVSNILEAARSDEGRQGLLFEEIDLVDIFGSVEDSMGILAEKKHTSLITSVDSNVPIFYGDWGKVRRITENLASNAIKFTQEGGCVEAHASYDQGSNDVLISVSDNGVGIKEGDLRRIFERFSQSDSSSKRRYSGSGLGLAVVKNLVEAHGGSIEVKSEYQKGSTFTVRLPARNASCLAICRVSEGKEEV